MSSMIPPEMMGPMAPGMGAPGMAAPPDAGAAPPPEAPPQEEAPLSLEDAASQALQMLNSALSQADIDPEEANFAEAATSALTKILASQQKNSDAAMGIGPAHKAMRKASKSQPSGGGASGGY